jgi:hypothetical protein
MVSTSFYLLTTKKVQGNPPAPAVVGPAAAEGREHSDDAARRR